MVDTGRQLVTAKRRGVLHELTVTRRRIHHPASAVQRDITSVKTVADSTVSASLTARLGTLQPDTPRRWGTLEPHEMLCHLGDAFEMVLRTRPRKVEVRIRNRPLVKLAALRGPLRWWRGIRTNPEHDPRVDGYSAVVVRSRQGARRSSAARPCRRQSLVPRNRSRVTWTDVCGRLATLGLSPRGPPPEAVWRVRRETESGNGGRRWFCRRIATRRSTPRLVRRTVQGELVTPPLWVNAAIRSVIWLGGAAGLACVKKPDGASVLAVRPDAIGWLAGGVSWPGWRSMSGAT